MSIDAKNSPPLPPLEYDNPWARGVQKLLDQKISYGELVTHARLCEAMGIRSLEGIESAEEYKTAAFIFVAQFKKLGQYLAKNHSMHFQSVRGSGYRVVRPEEQTAWALSEAREELRKILLATRHRLTYIDTAALTEEQKRENAEAIGRLAFFQRDSRKALLQ